MSAADAIPLSSSLQELLSGPPRIPNTFSNSLELHIPIPIPAPPTPLPIVIAYPVSASVPALGFVNDSELSLEPVPPDAEANTEDARAGAHEDGYELVDIDSEDLRRVDASCQENAARRGLSSLSGNEGAWEATINLFSALNVPLNIHKLRIMRASGKGPSPLIKLSVSIRQSLGKAAKTSKQAKAQASATEKGDALDPEGAEADGTRGQTEIEKVQGESWYLPSAKRLVRRKFDRKRQHLREQEHRQQEMVQEGERVRVGATEFVNRSNLVLPDLIPVPPLPSPSNLNAGILPASDAMAAPASAKSTRPLGYMYRPSRPLVRIVSCKSCGASPSLSVSSSKMFTPSPAYVYSLVTPSSSAGFAHVARPARANKAGIKRSASVTPSTTVPMGYQHSY